MSSAAFLRGTVAAVAAVVVAAAAAVAVAAQPAAAAAHVEWIACNRPSLAQEHWRWSVATAVEGGASQVAIAESVGMIGPSQISILDCLKLWNGAEAPVKAEEWSTGMASSVVAGSGVVAPVHDGRHTEVGVPDSSTDIEDNRTGVGSTVNLAEDTWICHGHATVVRSRRRGS